ncbi:MAG: hypothetical protein ABIJ92_01375 [Candidatus Aenigmatarchaeota archaeon]
MKEESVKVDCSFCGKEIECPPNMLSAEKHACYECFQELKKSPPKDFNRIHVDIPKDKFISDALLDTMMEEEFNQLWKDIKSDLKEMSKKEVAKEMFKRGATMMFETMIEMSKKQKTKRK